MRADVGKSVVRRGGGMGIKGEGNIALFRGVTLLTLLCSTVSLL